MVKLKGVLFFLLSSLLFFSCVSVLGKNFKDDSGVMYGMVFDENEESLEHVTVKINGKLVASSDVQGRFILKFLFTNLSKENEYLIELEKEGYEVVKEHFYYDPMSLLHIKMRSGFDLLREAEDLIDKGESEKAKSILFRVLEIDENRDESLFLLAILRYQLGEIESALDLLNLMSVKDKEPVDIFLRKLEGQRVERK